jgi:hypothetical protein
LEKVHRARQARPGRHSESPPEAEEAQPHPSQPQTNPQEEAAPQAEHRRRGQAQGKEFLARRPVELQE